MSEKTLIHLGWSVAFATLSAYHHFRVEQLKKSFERSHKLSTDLILDERLDWIHKLQDQENK